MEETNLNNIRLRNLEEEMKDSFLLYSMSVIASRALPDVRDGLKPVHRRILYAMSELNLDPTKGYKKSARITGDTMGKYHPHGNGPIYDAMARMAQYFSLRYMLVDGHGNFGSIDGDSPAAERYTEARLSKISVEMLSDIEKNTVDFINTYDEENKEPTVLPSRFPNILVNGSSGIAVGMATNIPPHNLTEVINALLKIIDNHIEEGRETELKEIIDIVKGPDFPVGAQILGVNGIKEAYATGRGRVVIRSTSQIDVLPNGREVITFTDVPYQVNKERIVERIGELVRDKKIEGISDLKDISNRHGIKIVVDLKKDANAHVVLNKLYKYTPLQETYSINMLALVKGEPKLLNLMQILNHYLEHQKEVVVRRTQFDLDKALRRTHILEGLMVALDHIDEVISIIRGSQDTATAKARLSERFDLSEIQANAIVEMRLRALTGLERERLEKEYNELLELIKELRLILDNEKRLYEVIKEEALVVLQKYGDARRTLIMPDENEINYEDLIDDEMSVITMTHFDYIKRLPLSTYKAQNRGGKGIKGMETREEDIVKKLFVTNTHSNILYFTNRGKVYVGKGYQIPEAGRTAKGTAIVNMLNLDQGEKVAAVIPVADFAEDQYIAMVTKDAVIKKTPLSEFKKINKSGIRALTIKDDDELITVFSTNGNDEIFLATKKGMGIRFHEENVRSMGRTAAGVRAIRLAEGDFVIGADILEDGKQVLIVSENGYGKCTGRDEFRLQSRSGKGLRVYKVTEKTGELAGVSFVEEGEEVMIINSLGVIIRLKACDISTKGRVTQGVRLINLKEGEKVISIAKILKEQLEDDSDDVEAEEIADIATEEV
ncbi:MAG: DNA gyrase subunit A [Defluviitaleaceae bacterium]|nr:DNA gyrase subunit A [Defluviitaleaceae bacterium]